MDLRLHLQVLSRHRVLLAAGLVAGLLMATLIAFKPTLGDGGPKLTPRLHETWSSEATLYLTQSGFPEGRAIPKLPEAGGEIVSPPDPYRFASLSFVYSYFASSDRVRQLIGQRPVGSNIQAQPVLSGGARTVDALPLITLTATARDGKTATQLNERAVRALQTFIESEQDRSGTPEGQRVRMRVLNQPSPGMLLEGRPMTGPIAALLLIILGATALAYVLENLRGSRHAHWHAGLEAVPDNLSLSLDPPEPASDRDADAGRAVFLPRR